MTPAALILQAAADGVAMTLTKSGRLRLAGDQIQVDRYFVVVAQYLNLIIAELKIDSPSFTAEPLPRVTDTAVTGERDYYHDGNSN